MEISLLIYNIWIFKNEPGLLWGWGGQVYDRALRRVRWIPGMSPNRPPGGLLRSDHGRGCSRSAKGDQVGTVGPHRQRRAAGRISQPGDCEWTVHRWQKENRPNLHLQREELWPREVKPFTGQNLSTRFSDSLRDGWVCFQGFDFCHSVDLPEMRTEGLRYLSEVVVDE